MSLILNIDTTSTSAFVTIAKDGLIIAEQYNNDQKDHAGFLQPAIKTMVDNIGIDLKTIDAIAVAAGPGSYTGLRVGMASAKGLCYALLKPLLMISSLEMLAYAAIADTVNITDETLICPMIDARRMEVFTAVYDRSLKTILAPCAMILDDNSYNDVLKDATTIFVGNAVPKWETVCRQSNVFFKTDINTATAMGQLSKQKLESTDFSELAYAEPYYIKEFYTTASKS